MTETAVDEPTGTETEETTEEEPTASTDATETESSTEETEDQPKIDWRDLIRDVPPEDLLKEHEALRKYHEGKAGHDAQRLAREKYLPEELAKAQPELEAKIRAEEQAKTARSERERRVDQALALVEEDPERGANELRKLREEEKSQEQEKVSQETIRQLVTDAYTRGNSDFDVQVLRPLIKLLHEDDLPKINGKDYGEGPTARIRYITDILEAREARAITQAVSTAQAEWEKGENDRIAKAREAGRKEALGEVNGGQKVDTGSGTAGGGGTSLSEILSWPAEQRIEYKRTHPQDYNKAVMTASANGAK